MEHDIPFGNSNRENRPTFLAFPLFLGIFQWDELTKRVAFTAEPEIPEILTNWKAPCVVIVILSFACTRNGFLFTDFFASRTKFFFKVRTRPKLTDFAPFLLFPSILN